MSRSKKLRASLKEIAERLHGSSPTRVFGFRLVRVRPDSVVIRMRVRDAHKQMNRVVHGGVLAMLADTAGGIASFLASPPGTHNATIEMKMNFLEAVERGELQADARVLRVGRNFCVVDCDVTDSARRLVGKALMTYAVIPGHKPFEARK